MVWIPWAHHHRGSSVWRLQRCVLNITYSRRSRKYSINNAGVHVGSNNAHCAPESAADESVLASFQDKQEQVGGLAP